MTATRARALFLLCVALQLGAFAAMAVATNHGAAPSTVTWALAASFLPYALALFAGRVPAALPAALVWAPIVAVVVGAPLVAAPPVHSDDLYRYLWEGRLWLEGVDPYRLAPADPALESLRDPIWTKINNKPLASIYPPLSQALFLLAAALGGQVWTVKLIALVGHAFATATAGRLAGSPRAAWALGLNPLLLSESALNGHFDILVGAAILIAAWAMSRQRFARAGVATCAAVGLKVVGVVLLPLLWPARKVLWASAFVSALFLAPLLVRRPPADPTSGLGQFATRWRGNDSVFALLEWLPRWSFDLDPERAAIVGRASAVFLLLALVVLVVWRKVPRFSAARLLVWAVLLLSPQVHPWYLGWLLPLELVAGGRAGLLWSAAVLVAYAPLDRWVTEGVWEMPAVLQALEYGAVFLALAADALRPGVAGAE